LKIRHGWIHLSILAVGLAFRAPHAGAAAFTPQPVVLSAGWQLQDAAKATEPGAQVSSAAFEAHGWYAAAVPGTVLTTLVNNHVYPEPLYGENDREDVIPESLVHTSYWYRTVIRVPSTYTGRHVWLNFDGINYSADVWVNGVQVGSIRGAFIRGNFDITAQVTPGRQAVVAVLVAPQPHPGVPHEHTLQAGVGLNGGISAIDGPTFLCTLGWDWLPAIHDRDSGIWQKVFLSASGPAVLKDPLVTTDLPLPKTDSSDVAVQTTVENVTDRPVKGVVEGVIENIHFEREVELAPRATQQVSFDPKSTPALHMEHPRLWWPNGYGEQNLYRLHLDFRVGRVVSDAQDVAFGVRKISYSVPGTDTLTISVNGVPVFIRGGDWGLDEGLKRIPRTRLDTEIRMHRLANLNMIRNWVGQSTGEDFYELCDKYGIMVWDEFFQPNPGDGPDPDDIPTYIANVRDKVLRFRNHPSIVLWCGRNEGYPPPEIDADLRKLLAEIEPTRRYQPSSTDGAGVRSHGPYSWRAPRDFYTVTDDFFKTETGSVSVPTLESIHGMMPQKDWDTINDDWAIHDFTKGNSHADEYPAQIAARYGAFRNLADFVRKAQMADYEAFRAMYEGRNAQLFHPTTAVITWMSNPAQPSFVWQIYHYDLEPFASFFGVMHASEMVHIQLNEATSGPNAGQIQVINNKPEELSELIAHVSVYNLEGSEAYSHDIPVNAAAEAATNLGTIDLPATLSGMHFIQLSLSDPRKSGPLTYSRNFYWQSSADHPDDLTDLDKMPQVELAPQIMAQKDENGARTVTVSLENPSPHIALMVHVQLRRGAGERVLPVDYSDNYVTILPHAIAAIEMHAAIRDFHGENPVVTVDGWNVTVKTASAHGVSVAPNLDAQPMSSRETGLPYQTTGLR
jgi:Exo-beta-D-glucosaminidase Ig-fold domain/Glycosyl hydrolases family 2/Glycosyl hydrolases family 2, sugar binding domain/Glycosyl hydrolases family 2, TIM barrel domain